MLFLTLVYSVSFFLSMVPMASLCYPDLCFERCVYNLGLAEKQILSRLNDNQDNLNINTITLNNFFIVYPGYHRVHSFGFLGVFLLLATAP